jgi:SAM-dependent methyltransferase
VPQLLPARATWRLLRAGHVRARISATRDGQTALRLALTGAALRTGVLDALAGGGAGTAEVARRTGTTRDGLLEAFLRAAAAAGLLSGGTERWRLTGRARAVVDDDLVRASYEAFAGFHTDLYRELTPLLHGGPPRRDVLEQGGVIARISAAFEPFVEGVLVRTVTTQRPRRILDVGCGAGLQLAAALAAAPGAEGVGVDADAEAAALARRTLAGRGLADRARVVQADVREAAGSPELAGPFDLALLANVVYYVPLDERVALLRTIGGLLAPGGRLLVVTTAAVPDLVSRHFDLLLRAQEGRMELPDAEVLRTQLAEAGLSAGGAERIMPGGPLIAVTAHRPAWFRPA